MLPKRLVKIRTNLKVATNTVLMATKTNLLETTTIITIIITSRTTIKPTTNNKVVANIRKISSSLLELRLTRTRYKSKLKRLTKEW